jgi:hypothetical protein
MATEQQDLEKQQGGTEQTAADKARADSDRDATRQSRSLVKDLNPGSQKPANVR